MFMAVGCPTTDVVSDVCSGGMCPEAGMVQIFFSSDASDPYATDYSYSLVKTLLNPRFDVVCILLFRVSAF